MNKKYRVEVRPAKSEEDAYLSITHDGCNWISINIKDTMAEIPLIIDALRSHLIVTTISRMPT